MKIKYVICILWILSLVIILTLLGFRYKTVKENGYILEEDEIKNVRNFEIVSTRINCLTIKLAVRDDKTYKIIYGYNNEEEISKNGTYSYDVSKIVSNNKKYNANEHGVFKLTTIDGTIYEIYDTNEDLNKFLDEIEINLDTCLELNY